MDAALDAPEPDSSGFIREYFLGVEIERGLKNIAQLTESLTDEANSFMNRVVDIIDPSASQCYHIYIQFFYSSIKIPL